MELKWKKQGDYLERKLTFDSQKELATFLLKVATQSDKVKHHCDMEVSKATTLRLRLTTHDEKNTVTEKDYELAKWIDTLK
ncbi:MAG TPA: 4a-hydroxytetrahydrobiopterin dehydratase [Flavobacteriaceae bacterium]|nr:4a-hydroxytetrahydrobiopterin dehydratase [Flavobacteriaceae bacterium]